MRSLFLFSVLMLVAAIWAAEEATTAAPSEEIPLPPELKDKGINVYTKVLGKSGKIMVSSKEDFSGDSTVQIQMGSLIEKGRKAGGGGGGGSREEFTGRKFNTFANQDFTFSPLDPNATYPGTNYSVSTFRFSTDISGKGSVGKIGEMALDVYIFKEEANMTVDGETTVVLPGSVKFNLEISKYDFCNVTEDNCGGDAGEALEVQIEVKGKGDKKVEKAEKRKKGDDVDAYLLGGDSAMRVSSKCQVDGEWKDLDTAPVFVQQGSKNILKLTLPKFTDKIIYDPVVDLSLDEVTSDDDNSATGLKPMGIVCLLFLTALLLQ